MKSSGLDSPAWNGTNSSGFSGLAGGVRGSDGDFYYGGVSGYFWSASANGSYAWGRRLNGVDTAVYRMSSYRPVGSSVRCVLDE